MVSNLAPSPSECFCCLCSSWVYSVLANLYELWTAWQIIVFHGTYCFTLHKQHCTISVGIFGYLNYLQPRTRQYILEALVKGLQRLEYRGYDSAGVAFDSVRVNHDTQNLLQTTWGNVHVVTLYVHLQKLSISLNSFILCMQDSSKYSIV